jgi:amino acid transporter
MKYARQFRLFFATAMICVFAVMPVFGFIAYGDIQGNPRGDTQGNPNQSLKLDNPLAFNITSITDFLRVILENIVMPIAAVVVVVLIIYTGFLFVIARGNEKKLEEAKQSLKNVIIGTVILFGSVAISYAIGNTICQIAPQLANCPNITRLP